jgi:hypothetical protein
MTHPQPTLSLLKRFMVILHEILRQKRIKDGGCQQYILSQSHAIVARPMTTT